LRPSFTGKKLDRKSLHVEYDTFIAFIPKNNLLPFTLRVCTHVTMHFQVSYCSCSFNSSRVFCSGLSSTCQALLYHLFYMYLFVVYFPRCLCAGFEVFWSISTLKVFIVSTVLCRTPQLHFRQVLQPLALDPSFSLALVRLNYLSLHGREVWGHWSTSSVKS
jgi:hypothetical protein